MAVVPIPHTFSDGPGNTASGVEVSANFAAILAAINGDLDVANFDAAAAQLFVKLATPASRKEAFGQGTVLWPGGGNAASVVIAHGLGVTPVHADAALRVGGGNFAGIFFNGWTADATNLTLYFYALGATVAGSGALMSWRAVG